MNLASALLGGVLIALAGVAWEIFPGLLLYKRWNLGTFNPITWWATFVMAVIINSVVEAQVLKRRFGVMRWRRAAAVLLVANSFSVAAAAIAMRSDLIGFRK